MRRVRRPSPSPKAAAKRTNRGASGSVGARVSNRHDVLHDEVDSGDSDNNEAAEHATFLAEQAEAEEAEVAESAEERRVRLAKEMIVAMDAASSERLTHQGSTDHIGRDSDIVTEALEEDALRRAGQYRFLAARALRGVHLSADTLRRLRGPRLSATCVAIAPDESFVVAGCKDGALVRWELPGGARTKLHGGRATAFHPSGDEIGGDVGGGVAPSVGGACVAAAGSAVGLAGSAPSSSLSSVAAFGGGEPSGHLADVLSVAVSADGRLIASGGRDSLMLLWDARTNRVVQQFKGHRGPVRALARRRDAVGPELYSASVDRTARAWDLEQRGYIETLHGHQEPITSLDALCDHQLLSGAEDRTVRLWKVAEETQLLFTNGHTAPVDAVALLHAESFVSGGQDGTLTLWSTKRKRPVATRALAHGIAPWGGPCWISALASPNFSDVAVSGSCDGTLRFWHCDEEEGRLEPLMSVPLPGFINGLAIAPSGKFLAAAVGQEHRLGRWSRVAEARNSVCIVPLPSGLHAKQHLSVAALGAHSKGTADV